MSFKISTVGCGQLANSHHGPAQVMYARQHPGVELASCCDVDAGKAGEFAKKFGVRRAYTNIFQMLEAEKPDAVCLLVPPQLICELTCQILELGYPLLLEKPPGMTVIELDQMIDVADRTSTPNQVAFNRRYTPLVQQLKKGLSHQNPIYNLRYDFSRIGRTDRDFSTTAIHGIDTAQFLAGSDYAKILIYYQAMDLYGKQAANIFMQCTFQSGATAQLNFTPVTGAVIERVTLHALNQVTFLELPIWNAFDAPGRLIQVQDGQIFAEITGPEASGSREDFVLNGFYGENAAFFDDIRGGIAPAGDLHSARQSIQIAEAIRERHSEITFNDPKRA